MQEAEPPVAVTDAQLARVALRSVPERYDQNTYLGRVRRFMDVTDPRTLLTSAAELKAAESTLAAYARGAGVSMEEVWRAQKVYSAVVHPDTGNTIFPLFRMSAFGPVNVVITAGMLVPNPSTASVVFWQWVNQSFNVAVSHSNRNASNEMPPSQLASAYAAAVTVSSGLAVGLGKLVEKVPVSTVTRGMMRKFVPAVAVSAASVTNLYLMRRNEVAKGISVTDEDGRVLGTSCVAGKHAVMQGAVSRIAICLSVLGVPPVIMAGLQRTAFLRARPKMESAVQLGVIGVTVIACLPLTIGLFPQRAILPTSSLEPGLRDLKRGNGEHMQHVFFNRGL